ncbi:serine/threonine-protein kinase [Histoplasma capsulatum G186AR]|uniref:non-specific serine/threonine protein kinase n=2 Tax=Ajellomyces capsulatus TaxID=5037 RepID=C0NQG5_AJECG|nr:serine/threonine-protein kinase [Histoplasma capsulatum G186AR]EEH06437.1 serine/threonine-protein kinase [Histoplasma capsulatum G186AR]KAG5293100.1 serine/threonine-protein kinase [Histoplasma capsulatum]QSS74551.1 serine/threonine-protein kinase [Histoplasma capsulatum G186AR]
MVWRLPGARSALPTGIALLLLPLWAAQQQQPLAHNVEPLQAYIGNNAPLQSHTQAHSLANTNDASAIETVALAAPNPAVRAPPARLNSNAGPGPQLQARSLQDWEVEDFVLLATVDGTIHARDRKTGAPRWALEVPSSPMVETIYHQSNRSGFADAQPEDDFIWIVEPSRDGDLYIYNQAPNGGLQKLGLTVKALVDETPYSGTDPPVTYTARKETTLYTVDARTGTILRVFSSRGSAAATEQSCRRVNDLEALDDEECETKNGTLTLGRLEYIVTVQNTETGNLICTIKYSEWGPNNRDVDLQSQYFRTMDERHIYSMHDGVIFGFDHSKVDGRRYTQRFTSPVARVFDVARPARTDSPDTPLVLLSQPRNPPDDSFGVNTPEDRESRVFVNCTENGGWYAMSEASYPLVTGRARQAECYEKDYLMNEKPLMSHSLAQQRAALAGVHSLNEPSGKYQRTIPSISGPPADLSNDTPRDIARVSPKSPPQPTIRPGVLIQKGWDNVVDVVVTLCLLTFGTFLYLNSHTLQELAKQKLDLKNVISINGKPLSTTPSTPIIASTPTLPSEFGTDGIPSSLDPGVTVNITVPTLDQDGDVTPRLKSRNSSEDIESTPRVRIQDPDNNDDKNDDVEELNLLQTPEKTKKKARRGRRGGVAHKRGKKNQNQKQSEDADGKISTETPSDNDHTEIARRPGLERQLSRTISTEMVEIDGSIRIGQLKVHTDKVLGHGSHGTVVYKGSFDGRDVAVKRMLVEFYDIASHEVGLLQESDDHKNVIRYFCREQTAGFLYIGLELCPASLQDVVEKPLDYPSLVNGGLDVPDVLWQITAGVRYLHSLKIVHRDLKPQNILVAAPKPRTGSSSLRLLISDFGLCKKLEDNQSSFRATTAHAAGTSGWRAPELLVDDDQTAPSGSTWDNQSVDSSDPAVVDPQTNRRATRAIDIFSLGCVFYYVLTRGGHPFDKDGKFMREANIVKGYHNLDDLQKLGDYAFEADDLIRQMLSLDPRRRPDATTIMLHPFFWSPADRLNFLCDVSDHFEFEPRDPPSADLLCLESVAPDVIGLEMDFLKLLPKDFKDSLGKQRKYTGSKMLDLLRALRNKRNHYNDMPEHLKANIGGLPVGYLQFWALRFPSLLINCHWVILQLGLTKVERFKRYFTPPA